MLICLYVCFLCNTQTYWPAFLWIIKQDWWQIEMNWKHWFWCRCLLLLYSIFYGLIFSSVFYFLLILDIFGVLLRLKHWWSADNLFNVSSPASAWKPKKWLPRDMAMVQTLFLTVHFVFKARMPGNAGINIFRGWYWLDDSIAYYFFTYCYRHKNTKSSK